MSPKNPKLVPIDWDFMPQIAKLCQLAVFGREAETIENTTFCHVMKFSTPKQMEAMDQAGVPYGGRTIYSLVYEGMKNILNQ